MDALKDLDLQAAKSPTARIASEFVLVAARRVQRAARHRREAGMSPIQKILPAFWLAGRAKLVALRAPANDNDPKGPPPAAAARVSNRAIMTRGENAAL